MAGDLEDFLKRAASRRQAKAAQETQQAKKNAAGPARAREYTDSRRERTVRQSEDLIDDAITGEIVDEIGPSLAEERLAMQQQKIAAAKKKAAAIEAATAARRKKEGLPPKLEKAAPVQAEGITLTGDLRQDVLRLMTSPVGLQQAFLLKEILDRPDHRW